MVKINGTPCDVAGKTLTEYLATTKQYYEGLMQTNKHITDAFFDSYKRDVDNSFMLYKSQRDADDVLAKRIDEVDKKVDVMAAIRPYQDALINAKIDNVAANANFNLEKRTCKTCSRSSDFRLLFKFHILICQEVFPYRS